jgi:hypothetical protein
VTDLDDALAALERLASSDASRALALCRMATSTDGEAHALLAEVEARVEATAEAPAFQRAVRRVAVELLRHRELDREAIRELTRPDADSD